MSLRCWASFSVGIEIARSVGACSRMTVCPSPRPRPWAPCAPRCGRSAANAPTETAAITPTAGLRIGLSSEVELVGKLHESSVENLRRLPEDAAGSRRAERPVGGGVIHDGACIEQIVEIEVGLNPLPSHPENLTAAQVDLIQAI